MKATPDHDEVPVEIRQRMEERFRDARWRIWVCAESDGDECGSGSLGVGHHRCRAGLAYYRGRGPRPAIAWIEVGPTGEQGKG